MARPTAAEFVDALRKVEDAGEVDAMVAMYADDATVGNVAERRTHHGPDGAREFWSAYVTSFTRVRSEFRLIVESERAIVLEWTSDVRTAAGAEARYDGVSVVETHDGRIVRFAAYFDPADLAAKP